MVPVSGIPLPNILKAGYPDAYPKRLNAYDPAVRTNIFKASERTNNFNNQLKIFFDDYSNKVDKGVLDISNILKYRITQLNSVFSKISEDFLNQAFDLNETHAESLFIFVRKLEKRISILEENIDITIHDLLKDAKHFLKLLAPGRTF